MIGCSSSSSCGRWSVGCSSISPGLWDVLLQESSSLCQLSAEFVVLSQLRLDPASAVRLMCACRWRPVAHKPPAAHTIRAIPKLFQHLYGDLQLPRHCRRHRRVRVTDPRCVVRYEGLRGNIWSITGPVPRSAFELLHGFAVPPLSCRDLGYSAALDDAVRSPNNMFIAFPAFSQPEPFCPPGLQLPMARL
jgi:hypothetical protein